MQEDLEAVVVKILSGLAEYSYKDVYIQFSKGVFFISSTGCMFNILFFKATGISIGVN